MRHHAEHVAAFTADASDVLERSVGISLRRDLSLFVTVAEDDPLLALESGQRLSIAEVVPFHMTNWDLEHIALRTLICEWRLGGVDAQEHLPADVFETGVAQERAGKKPALAEDLK